MPSGAKKRKALKKKKQQQSVGGTNTNNKGFNGDNLHGHDEHGSQDERESDSNLSSPGSQGNEEFGTKDPSATLSPASVKGADKEISGDADFTQGLVPQSGDAIAVERETDNKKNTVEKSPNSSFENLTGTSKIVEIAPALDSVKPVLSISKIVISEKSEDASTHSNLIKQEENPSPELEIDNSKVVTFPGSVAETSEKVESVSKSEIPVSSEERRLLLPSPPVIRRTSWLSCCGLFDAMTGSDR